jgi:putative ABC transport system permease protein
VDRRSVRRNPMRQAENDLVYFAPTAAMKYIHLILKNLFRNKRRTILTALSIAVCLFLFSALFTLPRCIDQMLSSSASSLRLVCRSRSGHGYPLPEAYGRRIAALPHVEAVDAWNWFGGVYHLPADQFPNLAIDPDKVEKMWQDWRVAKESIDAFKGERRACLVGLSTMDRFRWRMRQSIILRGTVYPVDVELRIVGTLGKNTLPTMVLFRRDYLQEVIARKGSVDVFWIKVDKIQSIPIVMKEIDETFTDSGAETTTESEVGYENELIAGLRSVIWLSEILAIIVLVSITLVAANTAAMSTRERQKEIAILRSIGFTSRAVLALLITESVMVALMGGLLGVGAGYAAVQAVSLGAQAFGIASVISMPVSVVIVGFVLAALIGLFSGLVPALRATRRNIVDALRMVS